MSSTHVTTSNEGSVCASDDLRSFLAFVKEQLPREYLTIDEPLSGDWQIAAITQELVKKMRMPVIEFSTVAGSKMPVLHNVCASLSRVAKSKGWSVAELEQRLSTAYDNQLPAKIVDAGPVRDHVSGADDVNLNLLPAIRYTESETHPYISAAHIVARDQVSNTLNVSFHRLMVTGKNTLAIFMTAQGHLEQIFKRNAQLKKNTSIAAFIGAHPLWSMGALAGGSLSLEEYRVIGGLLGYSLPVVKGIQDERLLIPAYAELALEGELSFSDTTKEGPYGEAFGYVSAVSNRPVFTVKLMSHRNNPLYQDIVPGQLEHLTMTGTATLAYIKTHLLQQYQCVVDVFLPTPMTLYVSVSNQIKQDFANEIVLNILEQQRFIKQVVLFDDQLDIRNSKQTQNAMAMHVQAHRDVVILQEQTGNGLDPSEINGQTTKWGINASSYGKHSSTPIKNKLPDGVVEGMDISRILKQAAAGNS